MFPFHDVYSSGMPSSFLLRMHHNGIAERQQRVSNLQEKAGFKTVASSRSCFRSSDPKSEVHYWFILNSSQVWPDRSIYENLQQHEHNLAREESPDEDDSPTEVNEDGVPQPKKKKTSAYDPESMHFLDFQLTFEIQASWSTSQRVSSKSVTCNFHCTIHCTLQHDSQFALFHKQSIFRAAIKKTKS